MLHNVTLLRLRRPVSRPTSAERRGHVRRVRGIHPFIRMYCLMGCPVCQGCFFGGLLGTSGNVVEMGGRRMLLGILCGVAATVGAEPCWFPIAPMLRDLKAEMVKSLREGRYSDALGATRQILAFVPEDDYAVGLLPLLQDRVAMLEARSLSTDVHAPAVESIEEREVRIRGWEREDRREPYPDRLEGVWNWPDFPEGHVLEGR